MKRKIFLISLLFSLLLSVSHAQLVKVSYPCDTTVYKDSSYTVKSYRYDTVYKEKCDKIFWIKFNCRPTNIIQNVIKIPIETIFHVVVPVIIKRTCYKDTCIEGARAIPVAYNENSNVQYLSNYKKNSSNLIGTIDDKELIEALKKKNIK